jgi:hypothetical protein
LFEFNWSLILQLTTLCWRLIWVYIDGSYMVDFVESRITFIAMVKNQQTTNGKILLSIFYKVNNITDLYIQPT